MNVPRVRSLRLFAGLARPLLLAAALLPLSGCLVTLPQAAVDPTRYYVLSTSSPPLASPAAEGSPVIHLRPIELASYLTARPIIVRRGDNEIEFREFARWGEPLDFGIGRVLREELLARGPVGAVLAGGLRAAPDRSTHELAVRVLACEGQADGSVNFRAVWEVTGAAGKPASLARGDFRAGSLKWGGKNEAELAARLSEAVGLLAAEISAGLKR